MTERFLLPCPCGRTVSVHAGQAGRPTYCDCGRTLQVPSLEQLTHLERAPRPAHAEPLATASPFRLPWGGLSLALLGFLAAALVWLWPEATPPTNPPIPTPVPTMTAAEAIRLWNAIQKEGLVAAQPTPPSPPTDASGRPLLMMASLVVGVLGLLVVGVHMAQRRHAAPG